MLARVQPGWPDLLGGGHLRFRAGAGTVVLVLTPMLTPEVTTVMVTLARRGLTVVAVDTLTPETLPAPAEDPLLGGTPGLADAPGRARDAGHRGDPSRDPGGPRRGPHTLDEVLRRLARRSRVAGVAR